MPNDSANFNEVLQVSVDVPAFKQGLDEIAQLYQQFKASLEGQDISNVLQVGSFTAIIDALNGIRSTIVETTSDGIQSFIGLGAEITAVLDKVKVEEAELAAAREQIANNARTGRVQFDNPSSVYTDKQKKLAEDIEIEQEGLQNKYEEKIAQSEARIAANKKRLAEEIAIEQQGIVDKHTAQVEASEAKIAAARAKAEAAQAKKGAFGNLSEDLNSVLKYYVLWQGVGAIIQGVGTLLASPFVALKSGVEYLEQTEKAADDLSGVINTNVKLSDNLATQFAKSRDGAREVVKAFQEIAIKDNVKFDDLDRIFKSFLEAGGAGTVRNLNEGVKAAELFALAIKASGASAAGVRSAVSDLPKFLNGTLAPTSKFLEVLGLTPQEAKNLAEEIKKNHNLIDELSPRMQKYVDATLLASGTNEELGNRINLIKERLEAIAAGPIFERINAYLKATLDYLVKNKDKLDSIATTLGVIADNLLQTLVGNLGGANTLFTSIARQVGFTAINLTEAVSSAKLLATLINPFSSQKDIESARQIYDLEQKRAALKKQELDGKLDPSYNPRALPNPASVLTDSITNGKTNPSLDKVKAGKSGASNDREDFLDDVAAIKTAYEDLRESAEESLKARSISHKEAAVEITAALETERDAYAAAAADYKNTIENDSSIKAEDKPRIIKSIDRDVENFNRQVGKQASALQQAANSEDAAIRAEGVRSALAIEREKATGLVEIYRQEYENGLISDRALLDQEIATSEQSYRNRLATVDRELSAVAKGTVEYARLTSEQGLLLQEASNTRDASALKSVALDEQIAARKRGYALQLLQIETEQRIAEIQANELVTGSRNILEETFVLRQKEIDAKRVEIQTELELARAKQAGGDAAKKASLALAENTSETLQNIAAQLQAIRGSSDPKLVQAVRIGALRRNATSAAANDVNTAENKLGSAVLGNATQAQIDALAEALGAAKDKYNAITAELKPQEFSDALSNLQKQLLGFDLGDALQDSGSKLESFGLIVEAAGGALNSITAATQAYSQGQKQGGTLGGIGGLLQSGPVSQLAALGGPIVSGIVSGIGSALSFVGGLFTAQATKIANNIHKDFDNTVKALQQGSATISQTLDSVTKERADAISRLSGQKGGKEQLDKLLPTLDDEIASLKKQQEDILRNFEESLNTLVLKTNTFNDALSGAYTNWVSINKQVQDYVNAGGSAAKAAQFLSLSLKDIQQQNQDALNQGQQQAIQDALRLNDLIQQKVDLERQYAQQVFALQNADSIERANNGVISRAQQLQQAQINNQRQLTSLNNEIALTGQKVTAEQKIFSISSDINELHREDNLLSLASLDLQLAKYASIKELLASITTDANGLTSLNSSVFGNQGVSVGAINVNIQTPDGTIIDGTTGKNIATSVYAELQLLARQGT